MSEQTLLKLNFDFIRMSGGVTVLSTFSRSPNVLTCCRKVNIDVADMSELR